MRTATLEELEILAEALSKLILSGEYKKSYVNKAKSLYTRIREQHEFRSIKRQPIEPLKN